MNPRRIKNALDETAALVFTLALILKPRPVQMWRKHRARKNAAKASEQERRRHEHRGRGER